MGDHAKIKKAIKGNKKAFQDLILKEQSSLYKMAYLYVKNEDDALDIVHESVYKAYVSIKNLKEPNYFLTWLTRIVINTAIDFIKKKKLISEVPVEQIQAIGQGKIEDRLDLLDAINQLEDRFKTIIILRYYKDFSVKQIAYALNCPEGTVKTQLFRATNKLRCYLREDLANE